MIVWGGAETPHPLVWHGVADSFKKSLRPPLYGRPMTRFSAHALSAAESFVWLTARVLEQRRFDPPGALLTTGLIAGVLHKNEVEHLWLDRATTFC
jgi:hypothetical protein